MGRRESCGPWRPAGGFRGDCRAADSRDPRGPPQLALGDEIYFPRAWNPETGFSLVATCRRGGRGSGCPSSITTGIWLPLALGSHPDLALVSPFPGMFFLCRIREKGLVEGTVGHDWQGASASKREVHNQEPGITSGLSFLICKIVMLRHGTKERECRDIRAPLGLRCDLRGM